MGLLDGKVALITGAGGGLGEAYANCSRARARRRGQRPRRSPRRFRLGPVDGREGRRRDQGQRGRAVANGADISTMAGGQSVFDDAIKHFGRADILVNNAGILLDQSFAKATEAAWDKVMKVHLKGTFCTTLPVFRWMRENGGGVIVNTSSTSGLIGNFGQYQLRFGEGRHLGPVERAHGRGPQIQHPHLDAGAGGDDPHDRGPAALQGKSGRGADG